MSLDIAQERSGEVYILALGGRLDLDSAATLQLAVEDLLGAGARHVLLDASQLGYLSSAGLEVLVSLATTLQARGSLRLCGLGAAARETIAAAGQGQRLAMFADRAAALASLPQAQPDPQLARDAAALLGAAPAAAAGKADAEVARAAAQLLGGGPAARPAAAAPRPEPEPVEAPPEAPGVLDRLKRLFGKS